MKNCYVVLMLLFLSLNANAQAPYLFKDIIPGVQGGFNRAGQYFYEDHPFSVVWEKNGVVFFTAVGYSTVPSGSSYTNDVELWRSDGTPSGTFVLKDINAGNEGSYPAEFIDINGTLYFTAYTSSSGRELWKSDGTTVGTVIVKEIISGSVGGFQTSAQFGYNQIPFSIVWQTGNTFYFVANNYASAPGGYINDVELWKSDGTDAGTVMVKDIYAGYESSSPQDFIDINGTLYFTAYNATSGYELWKSDGTANGTVIVKEIISGAVGGFQTSAQFGYNYYPFTVVWQNGGSFYFTANNYASAPGGYIDDVELWKSDGTSGGTVMVKDIYSGYESSYPRDFHAINGTLYFTAHNATSGRELWKTDGTTNGTTLIKEIISGSVGGFETSAQWGYNIHLFSVVWQTGNTFYFTANNFASAPGGYVNDIELWKSDGTSGGTQMVKDIYTGTESSYPTDFIDIGGTLYFTAYNAASGRELWRTDGTNGGTSLVKEIISGGVGGFETSAQFGYNSYPFSVVWQTGNTFYFTANNFASSPGGSQNDVELWKSDGTNGGTVMVKDIYGGNDGSFPSSFTPINGWLYFTAYNNVSGRELWKSDGTGGGTNLVAEINSGNVGGFQMASQYFYDTYPFSVVFNIGSYFYFVANDYASVPTGSGYENNPELWRSDGTSAGTSKVMEINPPGTEGSYPAHFHNLLGKEFFTAYNPNYGRELWAIDIPVSTGPENNTDLSWTATPNPVNSILHINCFNQGAKNNLRSLIITDISGKQIINEVLNYTGIYLNKDIDLTNLESGIYFVKLSTEKSSSVKKIIKQ